ncbi:MAG: ribosome silencing factor [Mariniphaga sp.]
MVIPAIKNGPIDLIDAIVEGIQRKKGLEIVDIDLQEIINSECDHYIICHGTSNTHVDAIAHSIEETVEELNNEPVWHRDGYNNAQWILLDYANIMVHVFQEPIRRLYDLESLWADGLIYNIDIDN